MINNPKVMILDEPFRGLDAMTKELMWEYYSRLYEENRRTNFFVTTDIDEAVFLADRILVMSNIPTKVRAVIEVDLPRPRRLADLVESDRANDIKKQALSILHAEAMRSFSRGSKPPPTSSTPTSSAPPRLMEILLTKPVVVTLRSSARALDRGLLPADPRLRKREDRKGHQLRRLRRDGGQHAALRARRAAPVASATRCKPRAAARARRPRGW